MSDKVRALALAGLILAGCRAPIAKPPVYPEMVKPGEEIVVPVNGDTWGVEKSTGGVDLFPPEPAQEIAPEPEWLR